MSALIELSQVSKKFNDHSVLKNLSLKIESGEFVSILGPSGGGKSTLLRLIAGLESVSSGKIEINPHLRLSFVFQDPSLLPWLNLQENVSLPLKLQRETSSSPLPVLDLVKLKNFSAFYPDQLSGGMKMRAAIARSLITKPQLLLMDEPFAALDESTRFDLQNELRQLWQQKKMTIIFVTHSISEAVYLSDRVFLLNKNEGQISLEMKIDLPKNRTQKDKISLLYNDYVTKFSEALRQRDD